MYITTGKYRKRKLNRVNKLNTRETMDRVKESLFHTLGSSLEERLVLDLFAGSGALGIEALSNGAKSCVFVDHNKMAYDTIKINLNSLNLDMKVYLMDYEKFLKECKETFDIIFLDPPYDFDIKEVLLKIKDSSIYHNDTLFIYEGKKPLEKAIKCKKYGDKFINIFKCYIIK